MLVFTLINYIKHYKNDILIVLDDRNKGKKSKVNPF